MKNREFVIRFELPRRLPKRWLTLAGVGVVLAGAIAYAAVTWPAAHTTGTKISSSDIDGYFNDLNSRVNSLSGATEFVVTGTLPNGDGSGTHGEVGATSPTGLAAHMVFTPPATGWVVVQWSLMIGLNNASNGCSMYANAALSDKLPAITDPYVSQMYLPTYSQYAQYQLTGTAVLPVTGGQSTTLYLNGTADCGNFYFRIPSMTARFEPNVRTNLTVH